MESLSWVHRVCGHKFHGENPVIYTTRILVTRSTTPWNLHSLNQYVQPMDPQFPFFPLIFSPILLCIYVYTYISLSLTFIVDFNGCFCCIYRRFSQFYFFKLLSLEIWLSKNFHQLIKLIFLLYIAWVEIYFLFFKFRLLKKWEGIGNKWKEIKIIAINRRRQIVMLK